MWNLVSIRLEIVLVLVQDRCTVCAECTIGSKIVLGALDGPPRSRGSCIISFRSIWRQCWCRCKIHARFVPNVPLAHKSFWTLVSTRLEIVLVLAQDRCTVCAEHSIGMEIILDAPDETPRGRGSCEMLFRSIWRQCYCWCKIGARFAPNVP